MKRRSSEPEKDGEEVRGKEKGGEGLSLIITVYNEENNIRGVIDSFKRQTRQPDEIVVVDGGSTDSTYVILKELESEYPQLRAYRKPGNISEGRNEAIRRAKYEIIAVADAGTKYHKRWLENLVKGFNGEVSFGRDVPLAKTEFQRVLGKKLCHPRKQGSSRNMIFLKKVWREVGGYPEDLDIGEDTLFDERIRRKGYKISHVRDAICYWIMRRNLKELHTQFYRYGYWDGFSFIRYGMLPFKHILTIVVMYGLLPYLIFGLLAGFFSVNMKIEVVRRFSYFLGFHVGLLSGVRA